MMDKKALFKIVEVPDASKLGDLPRLEIISTGVAKKSPTTHASAIPKPAGACNGLPENANSSDASVFQEGDAVRSDHQTQASYVGNPPLPALVIGLFLLVYMLLG